MRHADEGLLHAWLDGALVGEEADAVRQHLNLCANCRARLEEAGRLRDEADALLAGAVPADLPRPPFAEVVAQAQALAAQAHLPAPRLRFTQAPRLVSWRTLGWAASIMLAVGAGWWGRGLLHQPQRLAVGADKLPVQEKARDAESPLLLRLEPATAEAPAEPVPSLFAPGAAVAVGTASPAARASDQGTPILAQAETRGGGAVEPASGGASRRAQAAAAPAAPPAVAEGAFQALRAPTAVPPALPAPAGRAAGEADFAGESRVTRVMSMNVEAAPTFTPYTVAPELKNRDEVRRALELAYPAGLRDAGIGATTVVWAFINEQGVVAAAQVKTSSGYPDLDRAALRVTRSMRFSPGLNRDQVVKVWVQLPIVFRTDASAPYRPPPLTTLADAAAQSRRPAAAPAPTTVVTTEGVNASAAGKAGAPPASEALKVLAAAKDADTSRQVQLNAIAAVDLGSRARREDARAGVAERVQGGATWAPAPVGRAVAVEGLPILRSLPRLAPNELSRVFQRLPSGDTIEVVALALGDAMKGAHPPGVAPGGRSVVPAWSEPARPGALTFSATYPLGTVTIRAVLAPDSLQSLLRRIRLPDR